MDQPLRPESPLRGFAEYFLWVDWCTDHEDTVALCTSQKAAVANKNHNAGFKIYIVMVSPSFGLPCNKAKQL